jgi:hypothetical protein
MIVSMDWLPRDPNRAAGWVESDGDAADPGSACLTGSCRFGCASAVRHQTCVVTLPVEAPVPLVWPSALRQPARPPLLVYLDMNHWISLAQAATGHAQGAGHLEALDACRAARAGGAALFPLSATHYVEMYNVTDPRQRRDVAAVMEELSGFATLASRSTVMVAEVRAALDALTGRQVQMGGVDLLGFGVGPAFGMRGGIHVSDAVGRDITDQFAAGGGAPTLADLELQFERAMLAGPADKDLPALSRQGYDPRAAIKVAQERANQEEKQRSRLDHNSMWRRGRLEDVVAVRELVVELWDIVQRVLRQRGHAQDDVLGDRQSIRRFIGSMPSTEVAVVLKTTRHRDATLKWTANDINDIDAFSLAVPYCDLVVTEKFAHHMLTVSRVANRMNTVVLRKLSELPCHLV